MSEKTPPPPKWKADGRKKDIEKVSINKVEINPDEISRPYTLEQLDRQGKLTGEYHRVRELDPLVVRSISGGKYEIVDGHHRYSYAFRTGSKKVQVKKPVVFEVEYTERFVGGAGKKTLRTWNRERGVTPPSVMERDLKKMFSEGKIKYIKKDGEKIRG